MTGYNKSPRLSPNSMDNTLLPPFTHKNKIPVLILIAVALIIFGTRLHLINMFGNHTPYWDDWSIGVMLAEYTESGFDISAIFRLGNEHRGSFMKLLNIVLFELNSLQWDLYLTMIASALLWTLSGLFLIRLAFSQAKYLNPWLNLVFIMVLWVYPLSLFNVVSTIQTYLYFMILFSILGFWLVTSPALSLRWWVGHALTAAACLTAGGGSFAPVAVASVSLFCAIPKTSKRKQHLSTAAVAMLTSCFGLYLILSQGPSGPTSVQSMGTFFETLFKVLSWPNSEQAWPSIFLLTPICLLAYKIFKSTSATNRIAIYTLTMAAFGVMLAIAIAYARGGGGAGPAERYFDFLTIYLIASFLSLMLLQNKRFAIPAKINNALIFTWMIAVIASVPYQLKVFELTFNDRAQLVHVQEEIISRFAITQDNTLFKNRLFRQVPFPHYDILEEIIARIKRTNSFPYQLQSADMDFNRPKGVFTQNGTVIGNRGLYRKEEPFIGSFNLKQGAQTAKGEYISEVFSATRPYVMVPVTGYVGFKGQSLTLVGENNGVTVDIVPPVLSSRFERVWQEVIVKAPDQLYRIVAKDDYNLLWFAYAAPRSVGRLTVWAEKLTARAALIWQLGALILLFTLQKVFIRLFQWRQNSRQYRAIPQNQ